MLFLASQTMGFASSPNMGYPDEESPAHRRLALSALNVHWGYFSKLEPPKMTVTSGETVTVEMASHHACDDYDKMVLGDSGMESVFEWSQSKKAEERRGATGGGDGVPTATGKLSIGTPSTTTQGMRESEMAEIAELIAAGTQANPSKAPPFSFPAHLHEVVNGESMTFLDVVQVAPWGDQPVPSRAR